MRRTSWAVGLLWLSTPAGATPALTAPTDAAVALLADVRNPTTTEAMLRNLATLARTCEWARRYDVIVFHEGKSDALRPRLEALGNRTRLRLRARDISDEFATHAPATTDWPRRRRLRTFGIGYRRMCRFWFSGVFELADVRNLTYLLRLDTDSELRCRPGSRDPFELMARQRAVYGYVAVKTDHPMVAKNLTAFGAAYARRVPQIQDAFYRFPPHAPTNCPAPMFYTNFEIMNVSWFARPRAVAFARAVDASGSGAVKTFGLRAVDATPPRRTGMIFGNRWGDAPLRWLTLALFAGRSQLLCFGGEYDYRHRGPQDHCGLSFNISFAGCQAGGGGAPVLPPPLPNSL